MRSTKIKNVDGGSKILNSFVMMIFLGIDLILNSMLDYHIYGDPKAERHKHSNLQLVGLQVVVEITIFLILFLAMADTFLFRVGLLGLLFQKFQMVLIIQPIYMSLTLGAGMYRVRQFEQGKTLNELWKNSRYRGISMFQKIIAIVYYLLNLRATMKLGNPIFYNKQAWISLVKQHKKGELEAAVPLATI